MKKLELQTIFTNDIDLSVLDDSFYIAILNRILELKNPKEVQDAI